jgi:hypothetical protein
LNLILIFYFALSYFYEQFLDDPFGNSDQTVSIPGRSIRQIFGIEETLEYILFDSSTDEEDATPEQRTNHQLRRRIPHLEHDLRDITACCSAERERRMSLEALVGGKIFILI